MQNYVKIHTGKPAVQNNDKQLLQYRKLCLLIPLRLNEDGLIVVRVCHNCPF